jgi:hypothetical protein
MTNNIINQITQGASRHFWIYFKDELSEYIKNQIKNFEIYFLHINSNIMKLLYISKRNNNISYVI